MRRVLMMLTVAGSVTFLSGCEIAAITGWLLGLNNDGIEALIPVLRDAVLGSLL